jgi:hypothetical protein
LDDVPATEFLQVIGSAPRAVLRSVVKNSP